MECLERELKLLKILENKQTILAIQIKEKREYILNILDIEDCKKFKSDVATVSYVERKTIEMDKEKVLKQIENLPKYFDTIPEKIIKEHKEINKTFDKDIKSGIFELDGVKVNTKVSPMIRFKKK